MKEIIFATGNAGKMREIREIMADLKVPVHSMKEAGIDVDIVEDGTTFEENAMIKARAVAKESEGAVVMADDSGLEVDYLNKEPGIYSARYLGEDTSYEIKNQTIIDRLAGVPKEKRTARFVCAIAAVLPGWQGVCDARDNRGLYRGEIGGENGFGYDPIFYVPDLNCSTAELSPEEKNARSHRGNALRAMREELKQYISDVR